MRTVSGCVLLFCSLSSHPQTLPKTSFYTFNANWKPTDTDTSPYFIAVTAVDSNFEWAYYNRSGPMLRSEMHATHDGGELRGSFYIYNSSGDLDSMGNVDNGKRSGDFYAFGIASNGKRIPVTKYVYIEDSLITITDLRPEAENRVNKENAAKREEKQEAFTLTSATKFDPSKVVPLPVDSTTSRESYFPGGLKGWGYFLQHNLTYPEGAVSQELQGTITVHFLVDKNGKTSRFFILHSANFWLDRETLRVIEKSGDWVPACDHGTAIESFKSQPVSFKLEKH